MYSGKNYPGVILTVVIVLLLSATSYASRVIYADTCPMLCQCSDDAVSGLSVSCSDSVSERALMTDSFVLRRDVPKLTVSFMSGNPHRLTRKFFKDLPSLEEMTVRTMASISIEKNAFADLKHLSVLDLSQNSIRFLRKRTFGGTSFLKSLYLSETHLKDLGCAKVWKTFDLENLEKLTLNGNFISEMPDFIFLRLGRLKDLDLSFNQISFIGERAYKGLDSIEILKLSGNRLKTIPSSALSNLPGSHLRELMLDSNQIARIKPGAFNFSSLSQLRHLSLSYNMIGPQKVNQDTFAGLDDLQTLNLAVDVDSVDTEKSTFEHLKRFDDMVRDRKLGNGFESVTKEAILQQQVLQNKDSLQITTSSQGRKSVGEIMGDDGATGEFLTADGDVADKKVRRQRNAEQQRTAWDSTTIYGTSTELITVSEKLITSVSPTGTTRRTVTMRQNMTTSTLNAPNLSTSLLTSSAPSTTMPYRKDDGKSSAGAVVVVILIIVACVCFVAAAVYMFRKRQPSKGRYAILTT